MREVDHTDRVVLIARLDGDIAELSRAYDPARALIMSRGERSPAVNAPPLRNRRRLAVRHRCLGVRGARPQAMV